MDPGNRPHLVRIQAPVTATGTLGGETHTWHDEGTAWAAVLYGTGQERREAAQENATQQATFNFDYSPETAGIRTTWRLYVFDTVWDVHSAVIIGANRDVHVTATANLDAEIDS